MIGAAWFIRFIYCPQMAIKEPNFWVRLFEIIWYLIAKGKDS